jgi:hypothetical protein
MNRKQYNITQKAIKKFREACVKHGYYKTNTSYALVAEEGVFLNPMNNCFAGLAAYYEKGGKRVGEGFLSEKPKDNFALLVGLNLEYISTRQQCEITDEESVRYLDWLCNRSPWRKAFVSKSARQAYKQRTVVLSTTVAGNLMGGAGVAVRRLWEYAIILRVWLELTARGVPEALSYYLATCAYTSYKKPISWGNSEIGHHNLSVHTMNAEAIVSFIKGKPALIKGSYASGDTYDQYSHMWGEGGTFQTFQTWIINNFPTKPIKDGAVEEVKVMANPFAKAVVVNGGGRKGEAPWSVALDNMGLWWPEIYKELGIEHE